jgi:TnpA family transposase
MRKENQKQALLDAFDKSENKQAAEACRIAGVALSTFNFHNYKDPEFRRRILEKKLKHLEERIAAG